MRALRRRVGVVTVLLSVLAVGLWGVAGIATRKIAVAKGLPPGNWSMATLLLGPVTLTGAVFAKPTVEGQPRWSWWSESPTARAWTCGAAAVLVALVAVGAYVVTRPEQLDGQQLETQIEVWLGENGYRSASVGCPATYPAQSGYVFLCDVSGARGVAFMRVTVDNSAGDVEWQAVAG